eukprot:TRINITY_DN15784_c0_g1_i1.p1 TRINITY_DN15784_c0_g1~~TRINITY_DN15784_c0_g1_i1.p1  ORF type:complete len:125 (-),score=41.63 TRINITY_DN15784_c0_g1_i1:3-377(-)
MIESGFIDVEWVIDQQCFPEGSQEAKALMECANNMDHRQCVESLCRYDSLLDKQAKEAEEFRRNEELELPTDLDYDSIQAFSMEERERLKEARPRTLGAASRVSGIRAASLMVLGKSVKQRKVK